MSKSPEILDDREFLRHCLTRADMGVANLDAAVEAEFGIRDADPMQKQLDQMKQEQSVNPEVPEITDGNVQAIEARVSLLAQSSAGNPFNDQEIIQ